MDKAVEKYQGISPAAVLQRELKKQDISQVALASALNVQPQAINAIVKGRRTLTTEIALKIDYALGLEEGTMSVLQALYETKKAKQLHGLGAHPDLTKFRTILFWDTDLKKIDWQNQFVAVINRIMERGNEVEKQEIIRFYGLSKVQSAISKANHKGLFR